MFYGSITDFCTNAICPQMLGGTVEYIWIDSTTNKKMKLSAPQYIDYMASSIENMMLDETIFPTKATSEFPPNFISIIRRIFGQLFRLFAHIYHHHYDKILSLHEEPHLNSLFAHFISFAKEFDLLEKKELIPLQELIQVMMDEGIL
jgi:MOB kinase activator 1